MIRCGDVRRGTSATSGDRPGPPIPCTRRRAGGRCYGSRCRFRGWGTPSVVCVCSSVVQLGMCVVVFGCRVFVYRVGSFFRSWFASFGESFSGVGTLVQLDGDFLLVGLPWWRCCLSRGLRPPLRRCGISRCAIQFLSSLFLWLLLYFLLCVPPILVRPNDPCF